tara:strand:+ start:12109 stop:12972 length:864 start_codon:yes stop_codon:yes gene_type:complete
MRMEKKQVKIGIIGYGFVGKAVEFGFSRNTVIKKIDPKLNTSIRDLESFKPEVCFLCLPTPMSKSGQDSTIIESVVNEINKIKINSLMVLKSTILPSAIKKISNSSKNPLVYNPEFLREKHYEYDFENPEMIILAGDNKSVKNIKELYSNHSICKSLNFVEMDISTASLAKYAINCFLASKVVFFNQLKEIFDHQNCSQSWKDFVNAIAIDSRIGKSHLDVPGHDGKKGFGGACFPKDTYALLQYAKELDLDFELLQSVIEINNNYRNDYDELDEREKEQNVFFEKK